MDCAIVFIVLLSLHNGCHGSYFPPPPVNEICSLNVKHKITTIPITKTNQLTITETRILPAVTSYMDMPPITATDTFTVIEWKALPPSTMIVTLPPVTSTTSVPCFTSVNTIACTTTETMEPITETMTREVIKYVTGMHVTSTVYLTSTVTQPMAFKTIHIGDVTTTTNLPPHSIYERVTIVSTDIQPPQTKTVTSKWIMTNTPAPVTRRHPPVTHHLSPYEQTITITIPSTIIEPHSITTTTIATTSTICTTTYPYSEPSNPWNLPLPNPKEARPTTFIHGATATPSIHHEIDEREGRSPFILLPRLPHENDEREGITEHPFDNSYNEYEDNTEENDEKEGITEHPFDNSFNEYEDNTEASF